MENRDLSKSRLNICLDGVNFDMRIGGGVGNSACCNRGNRRGQKLVLGFCSQGIRSLTLLENL